jgi:hypothetical protein
MSTQQIITTPDQAHHLGKKPLPESPAAPTPLDLLQRALEQNVSLEQLERLQTMYEKWEANEARKEFVSALTRFKANPPAILKNQNVNMGNGKPNYNYATLDQVCRAVIQGLSEQGITHRWQMQQNGAIKVTCILTHERGHSEEATLEGQPDQTGGKNSIQAVGSTVTYLQRYTLLAATGLAAGGTDTDGNPPTNGEIVKHLELIAAAKSIDELKARFREAYQLAGDSKTAALAVIQAKDARKKELGL